MGGQTDGRADGWAGRRMGGQTDGRTDGWADRRMGGQTDGRTDMQKLIVALRNFVNTPKHYFILSLSVQINSYVFVVKNCS